MRKKNTYLGYKALYEKIIYFLMILQYVMSHIKEDHQADAMTTTVDNGRTIREDRQCKDSLSTGCRKGAGRWCNPQCRPTESHDIKTAVFTRRITAYHEAFASVGKFTPSKDIVNIVDLQCTNILAWSSDHSVTKLKKVPNLSGMAIIQLRRGSRSMSLNGLMMKRSTQNNKHCPTCNYMQILVDRWPWGTLGRWDLETRG